MAQENSQPRPKSAEPVKKPGLFMALFWHLPWKIIGILLASLLVSLLIEYVGMTFLWANEGAEHSRRVMLTESAFLSDGFTRSLLMAEPVTTIRHWVQQAYQWLFVDSGFIGWLNDARKANPQIGRAHVELQSRQYLVCRLLLEKKKKKSSTLAPSKQNNKKNLPATAAHISY